MKIGNLGSFLISVFLLSCATRSEKTEIQTFKPKQKILIIGHRGASGYRPEHTLASYQLAIDMGADFIEPDLVMTKDKVLIARHENEISGTTDVAEKFPKRKKTKKIDGAEITGWFTEDFTLKEIKTLRAKERLASRNQSFNGQLQIPTFAEILNLAAKEGLKAGRPIGVYPETKHPSYFSLIGLPLEVAIAKELKKVGWTHAADPVILQSFELSSLQKLKKLVDCRLVFLFEESQLRPYDNILTSDPRTYGDYTKPEELKKLSTVVSGIGPYKRLILPATREGDFLPPTTLVADAHQAGLTVHPYTFRSDVPFLAKQYADQADREYKQFFDLGVDGVFSDFTDQAVKSRRDWLSQ